MRKIWIYAESPPLISEGTGMSVLGYRLAHALGDRVSLVLTRRQSKTNDLARIGQGLLVKTIVHWDSAFLSGWVPFRLRRLLDGFLFYLWVIFVLRFHARRDNVAEILGVSGADYRFLGRLCLLARYLNVPYSVYVVDDYAEFEHRIMGRSNGAGYIVQCVGAVLKQASRVYSICPGMRERLRANYGVCSRILYPISDDAAMIDGSIDGRRKFIERRVVYVGSLNKLYIDALHVFCRILLEINKRSGAAWSFHMITRDSAVFNLEFAQYDFVTADHNCDRTKLREEVSVSELHLLPYSFLPENKVMVTTSFPSKFMDAVSAGRPILAFGPRYSSIIQHMEFYGCGYVAYSESDLEVLLRQRPWVSNLDWATAADRVAQECHSIESAISVLG